MTCTYPAAACPGPALHPAVGPVAPSHISHVTSAASSLPFTGADVLMLVVCGCLLLVAGFAILAGCRLHVH